MIPLREQEYIRQRFEQEMEGRVKIDFFTQKASSIIIPGREECAYCEETGQMLAELASLSEKLTVTVHDFAQERDEATKRGIDKVPGIVLRGPANRPLRFFGIPGGNEFPNFVETIIDASKQQTKVAAEAAKQLKKLKEKVTITVYVTPTCPHCPGVVRAAFRLALASRHIESTAVEIGEFPQLAQQIGVRAVPFTVFNGKASVAGAMDEVGLVEAMLKAVEGGKLGGTSGKGGATSQAGAPPESPPSSGLVLPR